MANFAIDSSALGLSEEEINQAAAFIAAGVDVASVVLNQSSDFDSLN